MAFSPITSWQTEGEKVEAVADFIFLGSKITVDGDSSHEIKKLMLLGRKAMINLDSILKSKRYQFTNKGPSSQNYGFPSSHVWIWELDHKEGWAPKNWCFQTVVLEKTLESPLNFKEIKPVNLKENQPWILFGKTDAEAETPVFWSSDENRWHIGKLHNAGKDQEQKEKRESEDGWDGWTASLMQWTWTWANSGRWWQIGRPGVLQSMGSERQGHNFVAEQPKNCNTSTNEVTQPWVP